MDTARPFADLPYPPQFNAALPALHRAFLVVNRRLTAPAIRAGLGPLFSTPVTGSMMLLRTRGRKSGAIREAPLGYVVRDGAIWCIAGFGTETHWFRNILADPNVECILPTVAVRGVAERVDDPAEWLPAYQALVDSLGFIGRLTVGDLRRLSHEDLERQREGFPLVRIRPTGIAAGAFDPGGLGWVPSFVVGGWLTLQAARLLLRFRPRRRR